MAPKIVYVAFLHFGIWADVGRMHIQCLRCAATHGLSNGCETLSHEKTTQFNIPQRQKSHKKSGNATEFPSSRVVSLRKIITDIIFVPTTDRARNPTHNRIVRGAIMEWKNVEKKLFTVNAINFIQFGQPNVVTHQRLKLLCIVDCNFEYREHVKLNFIHFFLFRFSFLSLRTYIARVRNRVYDASKWTDATLPSLVLCNGVVEKWPSKSHCLIEKHTQPEECSAKLVDKMPFASVRQMKTNDSGKEKEKKIGANCIEAFRHCETKYKVNKIIRNDKVLFGLVSFCHFHRLATLPRSRCNCTKVIPVRLDRVERVGCLRCAEH